MPARASPVIVPGLNRNSGHDINPKLNGGPVMLHHQTSHGVLLAEQMAAMFFGAVTIASVIQDAPETDRIIAYCLGGSVLGSWAYILIFKVNEHRNVVGAFLGNAILSFAFSPSICEWILPAERINLRSCMFISASMGLCSSWIITVFIPEIGLKLLAAVKELRPATVWKWIRIGIARVLQLEPKEPKGPESE